MAVPVIDLFAGPGGLGEGFARSKSADFRIAVSIEKDAMAFETLRLRAAHRELARDVRTNRTVWDEWDKVLADTPWNMVFDRLSELRDEVIRSACRAAANETWHFELGPSNRKEVSEGIRSRLSSRTLGQTLPGNSVLIGGPPCQAYSVVGRSRNRGNERYCAEEDHRHFLYREYLHVINEFRPAVFVMENVKGLLSSKVANDGIFRSILADLKRPELACNFGLKVEYKLVALPLGLSDERELRPQDFIVEAERFGIPQARHRVIILGIRTDVLERAGSVRRLVAAPSVTVGDVIADLPELRPVLSFRGKGMDWREAFDQTIFTAALLQLRVRSDEGAKVAAAMELVRKKIRTLRDPGTGSDRTARMGAVAKPRKLAAWYHDRPTRLLANHESRAHMPSDLVRYLFVAAFGTVYDESPKLADFPPVLLPAHRNVNKSSPERSIFKDRFRVQIAGRCSMTVTSHIGKDGHAFIHPEAQQCRSLSVREAARLQTFPDTYIFLGTRTSQYIQVGNAVPPYLASKIAGVVGDVLMRAGMA